MPSIVTYSSMIRIMEDRFGALYFKGTMLFEQLFADELEVVEGEILEANLESLTLNDGEKLQVLTLPNANNRTKPLNFRNLFATLESRLTLIYYYLTDKSYYAQIVSNNKAVANMGDPTGFSSSDPDLVDRQRKIYRRLQFKPDTARFDDFNFMRTLSDHYVSLVHDTFKRRKIGTLYQNGMSIPQRLVKFSLINPNPGKVVVNKDACYYIFDGLDTILSDMDHDIVQISGNSDIKLSFTHPVGVMEHVKIKNQAFLDPSVAMNQLPKNRSIESTPATIDRPFTRETMEILVYYLLNLQLIAAPVDTYFGSFNLQFVAANWSIERFRLSVLLSHLVANHLRNRTIITLVIGSSGTIGLIRDDGSQRLIFPEVVGSFNEAMDVLEDSMFTD